MINKHKSNKIKENSNTVRHLHNGTDHRHSKSRCDQSSPARRTIKLNNTCHNKSQSMNCELKSWDVLWMGINSFIPWKVHKIFTNYFKIIMYARSWTYFVKLLWERCQLSQVNIGSDNDLVPSGNKQAIIRAIVDQHFSAVWHHWEVMS